MNKALGRFEALVVGPELKNDEGQNKRGILIQEILEKESAGKIALAEIRPRLLEITNDMPDIEKELLMLGAMNYTSNRLKVNILTEAESVYNSFVAAVSEGNQIPDVLVSKLKSVASCLSESQLSYLRSTLGNIDVNRGMLGDQRYL